MRDKEITKLKRLFYILGIPPELKPESQEDIEVMLDEVPNVKPKKPPRPLCEDL